MDDMFIKVGLEIKKKIAEGEFIDCENEDLNEIMRMISAETPEERQKEGIMYYEEVDGDGNKAVYLDGGRGIRLKLTVR